METRSVSVFRSSYIHPSRFKCDTHQWGHIISCHPTPVANTCASQIEDVVMVQKPECWRGDALQMLPVCGITQKTKSGGVSTTVTRCRGTNPEEHPVHLPQRLRPGCLWATHWATSSWMTVCDKTNSLFSKSSLFTEDFKGEGGSASQAEHDATITAMSPEGSGM